MAAKLVDRRVEQMEQKLAERKGTCAVGRLVALAVGRKGGRKVVCKVAGLENRKAA